MLGFCRESGTRLSRGMVESWVGAWIAKPRDIRSCNYDRIATTGATPTLFAEGARFLHMISADPELGPDVRLLCRDYASQLAAVGLAYRDVIRR